uniref:(northern house mosquito) hypothetical protein n=1 Tax=Culex pipiens TaxID=7175 RepID=A0A8D7ZXA3_CULPI
MIRCGPRPFSGTTSRTHFAHSTTTAAASERPIQASCYRNSTATRKRPSRASPCRTTSRRCGRFPPARRNCFAPFRSTRFGIRCCSKTTGFRDRNRWSTLPCGVCFVARSKRPGTSTNCNFSCRVTIKAHW